MTGQEQVSRAVRVLLADRGEQQGQLAAVLGQSSMSVSNKLRNRRPWSLDDLDKLSEHFGVDFLAPLPALLAPVLALAGRSVNGRERIPRQRDGGGSVLRIPRPRTAFRPVAA